MAMLAAMASVAIIASIVAINERVIPLRLAELPPDKHLEIAA
jgi:hypothetical protein